MHDLATLVLPYAVFRWKQRDIHEKREARKHRIAEYEVTIETNEALLPRLQAVAKGLAEGGPAYFSQQVSRLKEQPSPEKPPHAENITYDAMVLSLLNKVFDEVVQEKGVPVDDKDQLGKALSAHFQDHLSQFIKLTEEARVGLAEDLAEQKKHITSDDLHVGFDSKVRIQSCVLSNDSLMTFCSVCAAEDRAGASPCHHAEGEIESKRDGHRDPQLPLRM